MRLVRSLAFAPLAALGIACSSSGGPAPTDGGTLDSALPDDAGAVTDAATDSSTLPDARADAATCTVDLCGTPPLVAACPSGGGPTVTCEAQPSGACGWSVTPCPSAGDTGGSCGGRGVACRNPSDFCDIPEENACGATDGGGTCKVRPTSCSDPTATVCGCDGMTYKSPCEAARAGASIASSTTGCR